MPRYCEILAWHGTTLCAEASSGCLVSVMDVTSEHHVPLLASIPDSSPDTCFISTQGTPSIPIQLAPRDYRNEMLPLKLCQTQNTGRVALMHPSTGWYLCALPPEAPHEPARLTADRSWIKDWEMFELSPVNELLVAPGLKTIAVSLECLLASSRSRTNAIVDFINHADASEAGTVLSAVWPLLTLGEVETLAKLLLGNRVLLERLATLLPYDIWASESLPGLVEWSKQRESLTRRPRRFQLAPTLDFLAEAGSCGKFASFGHACNAYARASVEPRRDVCIISTARNEGLYTLEWLAYHRAIGVEGFFFYSNNNDDRSNDLLAALSDAGVITWIDNPVALGGAAQPKAYGHALSILPDVLDYRWALIIDLDEHFVFNPDMFGSIQDFLRWHEQREVDAIAVNWKFVGSGGECVWRDEPLIRRFTKLRPEDSRTVKTMFRPKLFMHSHCHYPIAHENRAFVFRHAPGDLHLFQNPIKGFEFVAPAASDVSNSYYAAIYHYFYKSAEEYMWKFSRNRGDSPHATGISNDVMHAAFLLEFMQQHETSDFVLEDRIERCAPTFDAELAKLLSLPGVAGANAEIQRTFRSRMREVSQAFRSSPAVMETGELGLRFLQIAGQDYQQIKGERGFSHTTREQQLETALRDIINGR
jgi:hypothetical protein